MLLYRTDVSSITNDVDLVNRLQTYDCYALLFYPAEKHIATGEL